VTVTVKYNANYGAHMQFPSYRYKLFFTVLNLLSYDLIFSSFLWRCFFTNVNKTVKGLVGVKWAGMRLSSDELKLRSLLYYF
jgi:hypothetical protein